MVEAHSPLHDDEVVYRRVPNNLEFFADSERARPSPRAFRPHPVKDIDGLSLTRHGFGRSLNAIADRGPGKSTCLASLKVMGIRQAKLDVFANPRPENPGHYLVPNLNSATPRDAAMEMQLRLVTKVVALLGPFDSPSTGDPSRPRSPNA